MNPDQQAPDRSGGRAHARETGPANSSVSEPTLALDEDPPAEPTLIDFDAYAPGAPRPQQTASGKPGSAQRSIASAQKGTPPAPASPKGRRRRNRLVALIVVLVLVALLAAGVGIGEQKARSIATDRAQAALGQALGGPVQLTIHDRLVLLALARNTFDHVSGTAPELKLTGQGQQVTVTDVSFNAYGIGHVLGQSPITVSSLNAKGRVSYAEITRMSGVAVRSAGQGRVLVDQKIDIFGAGVTVQVSALPGVDPATGKLTFADPTADVAGVPIPQSILRPLLNKLTDRTVLPAAQGLSYDKLTADDAGFTVALSGTNLVFERS